MPSFRKQLCIVCNTTNGAVVKCEHTECHIFVHPMCAQCSVLNYGIHTHINKCNASAEQIALNLTKNLRPSLNGLKSKEIQNENDRSKIQDVMLTSAVNADQQSIILHNCTMVAQAMNEIGDLYAILCPKHNSSGHAYNHQLLKEIARVRILSKLQESGSYFWEKFPNSVGMKHNKQRINNDQLLLHPLPNKMLESRLKDIKKQMIAESDVSIVQQLGVLENIKQSKTKVYYFVFCNVSQYSTYMHTDE